MRNTEIKYRNSEKGGAGVKLVIVLIILFLVGHAAYNYIPVAYQGESFKQDMQTAVVQGMATPAGVLPVDMVKGKLNRAITVNDLPSDVFVQVKPINNTISAQVVYTKKVAMLPFGLYNYTYEFNHTATPSGFLLK